MARHRTQTPRFRSLASGLLVAFAALTIAACGGDDGDGDGGPKINTANYAKAIAGSVLQQHKQVVQVQCPPTVDKKKGTEFTCDVKLEVGKYPVQVTMTDDKGTVKYGNTAPLALLDMEKVRHAIGVEIRHQRHLGSEITCPEQVLQQKGLTFFCDAKVEGGTNTRFKVEQTDDEGHVTFVGL